MVYRRQEDADEALAEVIASYYVRLELVWLEELAAALADGIELEDWQISQIASAQRVRERLIARLNDVAPNVARELELRVAQAYAVGAASAVAEMAAGVLALEAINSSASQESVRALLREMAPAFDTLNSQILRRTDDIYRDVVARAVLGRGMVQGNARAVLQQAIREFIAEGIDVGPEGMRGRMNIADYARMATRTGMAKARLAGHLESMAQNGFDLVMIQPGPRACKTCDRWANKVMYRDGSGPEQIVTRNARTGQDMTVRVESSLDAARRAGWGHPNCRCALRVYLPGATEKMDRPAWDQEGYEAQQRQREIERNIRSWKRRQASAVTPEEQALASGKVREWQAAMRQHMRDYDYLKRQTHREQI